MAPRIPVDIISSTCRCPTLLLLLSSPAFPTVVAELTMPSSHFYRDGKAYPKHVSDSQDAAPPSQLAPASQVERPSGCRNFNKTPPFSILCSTMDRLRNEKAIKRIDTLTRFMQIWRTRVGNDFYPLIRLLLPDVR